jgi:hypothetical protein
MVFSGVNRGPAVNLPSGVADSVMCDCDRGELLRSYRRITERGVFTRLCVCVVVQEVLRLFLELC